MAKQKSRLSISSFAILALAIYVLLPLTTAVGQEKSSNEYCKNYNYGSSAGFTEVRELTLPATGYLKVDAGRNGGIKVIGGSVNQITVSACVSTHGSSDAEASALAKQIQILTDGSLRAMGPESNNKWSVSYRITVPQNTSLDLTATNGGIGISGLDSTIKFTTTNGGVSLANVGGDVRGRTTNGGVTVKLAGSSWRGSGLDVETTNGGVSLVVPEGYNAEIETGTVNGGFRSEVAALAVEKDEWRSNKRVKRTLNGGGPTLRVVTTNGGINVKTAGPTEL